MTPTAEWTHSPIVTGSEAPGVFKDGWLPDVNVFPELTAAREQHERIRAQSSAASSEVYNLKVQIEAAHKQREDAMREAYLAGEPEPEPVETAALERELLAQAEERNRAASAALFQSVNSVIALVVEHREEWLELFARAEAGHVVEAEAALAKYREAVAKKGMFAKIEHWVDRTGGVAAELPAMHFPYADIEVSSGDAEQDKQDALLKSYAGDGTLISDDRSRALEAKAQRPPAMAEEELEKLNTAPLPPGRTLEQRRSTYRTDQPGR
jgi:hypothetical protein